MLGFEAGALSPVRIVHMWFFLESSDPELQVLSHSGHGALAAGWNGMSVSGARVAPGAPVCNPAPSQCALAMLPISTDKSLSGSFRNRGFPALATF